MPRLILISATILLLALGAWLAFRAMRPEPPPAAAPGETLQKSFPPELVFRRAFWRRPTPEDRILHADRREWSDSGGVTRWQAFLAVEPGPTLRAWLATNPFSLATVPSPSREIPNPPAWFPKKTYGFTIQQSPIGNMLLLTAPGGSPVYFTDHGQGFTRPAATTTASPAPNPIPQNRLPNAPPPIPEDQSP
jgi:hypothetical protein